MRLLEPLTLGSRTAPNRVLFGPHETNLGNGRRFSERHVAYYAERAQGGAGIIVTEEASVHSSDWPYERAPLAETAVDGWRAIVDRCRPHGALVIAAIGHAGGQGTAAYHQRPLWAPSDEPEVNTREVPKIMEIEDIAAVVDGFGRAAVSAVAAGVDGVEVNAGQHSLIRQFLSGLTNRRDDDYGADRLRFAREVLTDVRGALGPDRILGVRLSCDEMAPWAGITPEMATDIAIELADLIDHLVVVRGSIFTVAETRPTLHHGTGFTINLAGQIRRALRDAGHTIPVFAQGSLVDTGQAEWAVNETHCDGVEMTRAQIADPQLVAKLRTSSDDQIRPCVLCNQWCKVRDNRNPIVSCIVNPRAGHETVDPIEPDGNPNAGGDVPDTVVDREPLLVIGGGPAGLEAARTAALRGATVRLVERSNRLGGAATVAAVTPGQRALADFVSWLEQACRQLGVTIETGVTLSAEAIDAWSGPVVIATGGRPGPRSYQVRDGGVAVDATHLLDALLAQPQAGDTIDQLLPTGPVAVWDPLGWQTGVAVAELLAAAGRSITLVTPDAIAGNMLALSGDLAGSNVRLQQAGVTIARRQRLRVVNENDLEVQHAFTNEMSIIDAVAVVDCGHRVPDDEVWISTGRRHVRIGDVVAPRTVGDAVREARAAVHGLMDRELVR